MKNKHLFMARKRRKGKTLPGTLPRRPPNRHRTPRLPGDEKTNRSRPLFDETPWGKRQAEKRWTKIFGGREKIGKLFRRAGINLRL